MLRKWTELFYWLFPWRVPARCQIFTCLFVLLSLGSANTFVPVRKLTEFC